MQNPTDTAADELDFFPFGQPDAPTATPAPVAHTSARGTGPFGTRRDDAAVADEDNRRVLRSRRSREAR